MPQPRKSSRKSTSPRSPSPPPSPDPTTLLDEGADPSATSSTDSSTVEASGGFIAQPGPEFDPRAAAEQPVDEPEPKETASDVKWDRQRVRYLLENAGTALHAVAAVDPLSDEWRMTQDDLTAITPPLTNILNRYTPTKAAAAAGDEAALAIGLGGYIFRSYVERKAALERLAQGNAAEAAAPVDQVVVDDAGLTDEDDIPPLAPRR